MPFLVLLIIFIFFNILISTWLNFFANITRGRGKKDTCNVGHGVLVSRGRDGSQGGGDVESGCVPLHLA